MTITRRYKINYTNSDKLLYGSWDNWKDGINCEEYESISYFFQNPIKFIKCELKLKPDTYFYKYYNPLKNIWFNDLGYNQIIKDGYNENQILIIEKSIDYKNGELINYTLEANLTSYYES
jgi:hypothetical protein